MPQSDAAALLVTEQSDEAKAVVDAIQAYELAESALQRRVRLELGVGASDLAALRFIRQRELAGCPARVRDLQQRFGASSGAATSITDRLRAAGLIAKPHDDRDGRVRVLTLTPTATERLRTLVGESPRLVDELLASVSTTESQRLVDLLQALTEIMEATASGTVAARSGRSAHGEGPDRVGG